MFGVNADADDDEDDVFVHGFSQTLHSPTTCTFSFRLKIQQKYRFVGLPLFLLFYKSVSHRHQPLTNHKI